MLYLPIHIISRIRDFRIQFVNRFLNIMNDEECHPCFYFSNFFLSKVSNLNYDVQLFLLDGDFQYRNISTFHQELIKTWKCFESSWMDNVETSVADILEPLFFNPILINPKTEELYYFEHFVSAGVTKVKDLMDLTNKCKYSSSEFISKINIRSERCLQQHLDLLWSSLPLEWTCILNHFSNGGINIGTKY